MHSINQLIINTMQICLSCGVIHSVKNAPICPSCLSWVR